MQKLKDIRWIPIVMLITIIAITAFQVYWLKESYKREKWNLERTSNFTFRETVQTLQARHLRIDKQHPPDSMMPGNVRIERKIKLAPNHMIRLANVLRDKVSDTLLKENLFFSEKDSLAGPGKPKGNRLIQFLFFVDSLQDSVRIKEIQTAYVSRMKQQNIEVPFCITKYKKTDDEERAYNEVTIGFSNPVTYKIDLGNTFPYLMKRISIPILLSLSIVGFTIFSFVLLYKNILKQKKLAEIKNDFISNITHELKTPIATVSVAVEALRNFSSSISPERSKEYLDISANELQRLSLLVDKVLKLSMFEKKEIDLKYEPVDMQHLIHEVTSSLRLQFEKYGATVSVAADGDTTLEGDRLHLVSVIFNLLDNALKYSRENPRIKIDVAGNAQKITLTVTDNGIGIPDEYREKIFEKFFRVPTGNLHNAKGYGLGLSYVAQVVEKHKGSIKVESAEGGGSKFAIILPKETA